MAGFADRTESTDGTRSAGRPWLRVGMPLALISYLRRGSACTSTLDLLEALKQNGIPVVITAGDNHGDPLVSPVAVISHANFDGLLGIEHTQKILVGSAHFGTFFEVAESLKRGSRFVRRDACAYQR